MQHRQLSHKVSRRTPQFEKIRSCASRSIGLGTPMLRFAKSIQRSSDPQVQGYALHSSQIIEEAAVTLETIAALQTTPAWKTRGAYLLGECHKALGNYDKAEPAFAAALPGMAGTDAAECRYRLAVVRFVLNKFGPAAADFAAYIKEAKPSADGKPAPHLHESNLFIGRCRLELEDFKAAEKQFSPLAAGDDPTENEQVDSGAAAAETKDTGGDVVVAHRGLETIANAPKLDGSGTIATTAMNHIRKAIDWLVKQQKEDGDLRGGGRMYCHGIAAIALCEAYGVSGDQALKEPAERAIAYILASQSKSKGGWRYGPGEDADTSVTGWQYMALHSARMAGLEVPEAAFVSARRWFDHAGGGKHGGLDGYSGPEKNRHAMIATGMFCRHLDLMPPTNPKMQESADGLKLKKMNVRSPGFYYVYYATLALYQHQGPIRTEWNDQLKETRPLIQRKDGNLSGSWDEGSAHAVAGGRVVSTAMATLIRQTAHRGGKRVTVVKNFIGIGLPEKQELAKKMQMAPGVGGTVKDGCIEIQGDNRDEVKRILIEAGFNPVFAGG